MRAWSAERHGTVSELALREHEVPACGEDEVLIRVQAAAINPADPKVLENRAGGKFIHAQTFPLFLGFDFSGIVERAGAGVSVLSEGDEVFGFLPYSRKTRQGTFAEYVAVSPETVAKKPEGVSHAEAASAATVATTALQGLRDKGGLESGGRVLVNGASGGVGSCAVQIARAAGAEVWGTCSAANLEYVRALGADRAVDYRATRLEELGERFDIVFDVAATSSYGACAPILAAGGTYVTLLPSARFVTDKIRSLFSSKACRMVIVSPRTEDLSQVARWLEEGRLSVPIEATYGFDELPDALWRMEEGSVRGKIAVVLEREEGRKPAAG